MKVEIFIFYIYRILSRLYFYLPVLFIFLYSKGMSVFNIELLLSVYGMSIYSLSSLKKKMMSFLRNKTIIVIGETVKAAGLLIVALYNDNLYLLIVAECLSGLGYCLTAGTDSVLLRSLCGDMDKQLYQKHESASGSYMFLSVLISGVIGGILFKYDPSLPFYISVISSLISAAVVYLCKDNHEIVYERIDLHDQRSSMKKISFYFLIKYYAMTRAFILASFVGFIPLYLYKIVHVDLMWFGFILGGFTLSGFLSGKASPRITSALHNNSTTKLISALVFVSFLGLYFGGLKLTGNNRIIFAILSISMLGFASGLIRPFVLSIINSSDENKEIKTNSINDMEANYGVWNVILLVLGGTYISHLDVLTIMPVLAVTYILFVILTSKIEQFKFN